MSEFLCHILFFFFKLIFQREKCNIIFYDVTDFFQHERIRYISNSAEVAMPTRITDRFLSSDSVNR